MKPRKTINRPNIDGLWEYLRQHDKRLFRKILSAVKKEESVFKTEYFKEAFKIFHLRAMQGKSFGEISKRLSRSPRKVRFAYRVASNIVLGELQLWSKLETDKGFQDQYTETLEECFLENMESLARLTKEKAPRPLIRLRKENLAKILIAFDELKSRKQR